MSNFEAVIKYIDSLGWGLKVRSAAKRKLIQQLCEKGAVYHPILQYEGIYRTETDLLRALMSLYHHQLVEFESKSRPFRVDFDINVERVKITEKAVALLEGTA